MAGAKEKKKSGGGGGGGGGAAAKRGIGGEGGVTGFIVPKGIEEVRVRSRFSVYYSIYST